MLPLSNCTVSIYRAAQQTDRWPDTEPELHRVMQGVRAALAQPIRPSYGLGADPLQEMLRLHFYCDTTDSSGNPVDIRRNDVVKDEIEGVTYVVLWVDARPTFAGLDYIRGVVMHRELEVSAAEQTLVDS